MYAAQEKYFRETVIPKYADKYSIPVESLSLNGFSKMKSKKLSDRYEVLIGCIKYPTGKMPIVVTTTYGLSWETALDIVGAVAFEAIKGNKNDREV